MVRRGEGRQLGSMGLDDKLQAMEQLWADLSKDPAEVVSPAWHGDVLRSRREQVQQGKASFQSWETAMGELGEGVASGGVLVRPGNSVVIRRLLAAWGYQSTSCQGSSMSRSRAVRRAASTLLSCSGLILPNGPSSCSRSTVVGCQAIA